MQVTYTALFLKDISAIQHPKTLQAVESVIAHIKTAPSLISIKNIKKLKGHKNHYRIRMGDYRLGIFTEGQVVELSRLLHRKEIYRYFP